MHSANGIQGVLLDVDGTLLDSNDAHAAAWQAALAQEGLAFDHSTLRRLVGMGSDHLLPSLGLSEDAGPGKSAKKNKATIFQEKYLPGLRPQRGARSLVERMAADGIKRIVATSAGKDELVPLLRAAGIEDLIDTEATSSHAERSKPDPDIVQAAIDRSGMPAGALVMLGDTPYDVSASVRAGVKIIGLRCGGWADKELSGAIAIYDDPADLLARFDESVFVR
jgi:phosphoglycolate phosphatase-like HAD superfamily hydrolase